jgi:hypothetical protein
VSVGRNSINASTLVDLSLASQQGLSPKSSTPELDAASEAKKIAFDRVGAGDRILLDGYVFHSGNPYRLWFGFF